MAQELRSLMFLDFLKEFAKYRRDLFGQPAEHFPILLHDEPCRRHLLRGFDVVVMKQETVWCSDELQRIADFCSQVSESFLGKADEEIVYVLFDLRGEGHGGRSEFSLASNAKAGRRANATAECYSRIC